MIVSNPRILIEAQKLLTQLYGGEADFRDGQYEAIEAALTQHRTLVVQRTGWGKSLVYFLCTKLLRRQGKGVTIVVSPLLVLMQNQTEAADHLGLSCAQLNSRTKKDRTKILEQMAQNELDIVFVTPETLFQTEVQENLKRISIGLFVIDEAHCISDWGHDFRLEYSRLKEVIRQLPSNVPLLATTATANNRVAADLQAQLGDDVFISRGPLARDSLYLQVLPLESRAERCAWILENLNNLPGSGIIYCLTRRDCDTLAEFLQKNGISAVSYHSGNDDATSQETEEMFRQNRIKAIVATVKLGMGYDKGDISFIIHFQMPSNIVSYYQQIGRAGRNIPKAYVFLMSGSEDEEIIDYFIRTAFPSERETTTIMKYILDHGSAAKGELEASLNIQASRIEKALMFLCSDHYLVKEGPVYRATTKPYVYQGERYQQIMDIRREEMRQMKGLTSTKECLSKYIIRSLDDPSACDCGHCVNCTGHELLPSGASPTALETAAAYLNGLVLKIKPRKQWPKSVMPKLNIAHVNQEGLCLSKYGDPGCGELVKQGKYSSATGFSDELVQKSAEILRPFVQEHGITHMTCVPSLRTDLVGDFCGRLAARLGIPFLRLLQKRAARQQKEMENSAHQCINAYNSFFVAEGASIPPRILLVDDIVDSKWTLTVCGFRLMEQGCEEVYPFALADSSTTD